MYKYKYECTLLLGRKSFRDLIIISKEKCKTDKNNKSESNFLLTLHLSDTLPV